MSVRGWPGENCRGDKPGADGGPALRLHAGEGFGSPGRTSRLYRIAELMVRYRAVNDGKVWRFRDLETGTLSTSEYADEAMAASGARLSAACDIHQLFDQELRR